MVKTFPKLKYKILNQGGPIVNTGWIISQSDEMALIVLDFKSKNCQIEGYSDDSIFVGATENSTNLELNKNSEPTEIKINSFKGFEIICSEFRRYSLFVTLLKKNVW